MAVLKFLYYLLICGVKIQSRPLSEIIVFPNDNRYGNKSQSYLNLNHENEILPFYDAPKTFSFAERFVQQELENGEHFQGDIMLMQDQQDNFASGRLRMPKPLNTGLLGQSFRWPKDIKGYVIVPYHFQPHFCKNKH